MRGQLRLASGAIVREIRPIDFKNALTQLLQDGDRPINEVTSEHWDNALLSHSDLIEGEVTENVKLAFMKVNASFFTPAKAESHPGSAKKLVRLESELNLICVALIERGHRDCWQYGWQFFLAAQESFKQS